MARTKGSKNKAVFSPPEPTPVEPVKVRIGEVSEDLGREDLNILARKINEIIKTIN